MDSRKRTEYLYLFCNVIMTLLVITYTVTIREDYGSLCPRQHHRYYSPLFLPLAVLFLDAASQKKALSRRKMIALLAVCSVYALLVLCFLPEGGIAVSVDSTLMKYYYTALLMRPKARLLFRIVLAGAVIGGAVLLCKEKRKTVLTLSLVLMLGVEGGNTILTASEFLKHSVDPAEAVQLCALDAYLQENAEGEILYVRDELYSPLCKRADTLMTVRYGAVLTEWFTADGDTLPNIYTAAMGREGRYERAQVQWLLSESPLSLPGWEQAEVPDCSVLYVYRKAAEG